jgi:hypothetical protein
LPAAIAATIAVSVPAATAIPTTMPPAAATPAAMAPTPVKPRARANEDAAIEPIRPIVPVRGAGVGVVGIIAPLADRGTINYRSGNNRGSDSNIIRIVHILIWIARILILGRCRCRQGHSKQCCQNNQAKSPHKISSCFHVPLASNRGSGDNHCHQHCRLLGICSHPASNDTDSVPAIKLRFSFKIHSHKAGKAAPPAVVPGETA